MMNSLRVVLLVISAGILSFNAHASVLEFQPIQICDDAGANCATMGFFEDETDKIWAQAGIDISFAPPLAQIFNTDYLDVGYIGFPGDLPGGPPGPSPISEYVDVMADGRMMVNDWDVTGVVNLFFVHSLDHSSTFLGLTCGPDIFSSACAGEAGIFIAEGVFTSNRIDTIAHEIGHLLELRHTSDDPDFVGQPPENLMTGGAGRSSPGSIADITPDGNLDRLTGRQINTVLQSKFLRARPAMPVPLPPTLLLLVLGLACIRVASGSRVTGRPV